MIFLELGQSIYNITAKEGSFFGINGQTMPMTYSISNGTTFIRIQKDIVGQIRIFSQVLSTHAFGMRPRLKYLVRIRVRFHIFCQFSRVWRKNGFVNNSS